MSYSFYRNVYHRNFARSPEIDLQSRIQSSNSLFEISYAGYRSSFAIFAEILRVAKPSARQDPLQSRTGAKGVQRNY